MSGPGWSADAQQAAESIQQGKSGTAPDRNAYFIGDTIANLRGLDPSFPAWYQLALVDGRRLPEGTRIASSASSPERVISCNFTLTARAPVLVDTMGGRTRLPSTPRGTLSACTKTGTGKEVLLVYSRMQADRPYSTARVFDTEGRLLAEAEFDQAGTLEFTIADQQYVAQVPAP